MTYPILYSFRRCPYAMRARMGLYGAQVKCEHREVVLRDKPAHMLEISPKGTVPVLLTTEGQVIDESLDIMLWALSQNDSEQCLPEQYRADILALVKVNDEVFKKSLDRYKYPSRYPDEDCSNARDKGVEFLQDLNARIAMEGALFGQHTTLADIAIFPFVRQFAHVDRDWFYAQPLPALHIWLRAHLESDLFKAIMAKHAPWQEGDGLVYTLDDERSEMLF